jgi:cell fate regulator YaaT (PSP1 superfamily)
MKRVDVEFNDGAVAACSLQGDLAIQDGNECIVDCGGVLEHAVVVRSREVEDAGSTADKLPVVLRRATLQDQAREKENGLMGKMARETCQSMITKLKLNMRLVTVRFNFDKSVLKVLFAAEDRVDFRQLIKDLNAEYKTRIEIHQIGIRDEARIVGGKATCGRNLCCCDWLKRFEPVNVRMAKVQGLSLNPVAIGGMCGRLKCCLRYEYECYVECGRNACRAGAGGENNEETAEPVMIPSDNGDSLTERGEQ